jgi:hypothetical protein
MAASKRVGLALMLLLSPLLPLGPVPLLLLLLLLLYRRITFTLPSLLDASEGRRNADGAAGGDDDGDTVPNLLLLMWCCCGC